MMNKGGIPVNINDTLRYLNIGLPDDIQRRKAYGDFEGAVRLIDRRLSQENTPQALRCCLIAQKEIMRWLPGEYPYTREEALAVCREHIPDFTEEEFDERVDAGKIGWIYVNGEMHFFGRFFPTMCKADPVFADRAGEKMYGVESVVKTAGKGRLDLAMEKMKTQGSMTNRIRIRAHVRLKDENFVPGMFIRVHLPIPAACDQQSDIKIEKMYPEGGMIAPETAEQRAVCWEEHMMENHEFSVEYSYTHKATYHDVSKITADPVQPTFDTQEEAPHILFTPYIKELVNTLTEGVTDPLEKARIFYDLTSSWRTSPNPAPGTSPVTAVFSPCSSSPFAAAPASPPSGRAASPLSRISAAATTGRGSTSPPTAGSTPIPPMAPALSVPKMKNAVNSISAILTLIAW